MNSELRKELVRIGKSAAGLEGKFYFGRAKDEDDYPYASLTSITGVDDEDTEDDYTDDYFQVTLYGEDLDQLEAIAEDMHGKLQHKEDDFNMPHYHVDNIYREFTKKTQFDDVWQIVMQYRIQLTKI